MRLHFPDRVEVDRDTSDRPINPTLRRHYGFIQGPHLFAIGKERCRVPPAARVMGAMA